MPNPTGTINADEAHSTRRLTGLPTPTVSDEAATKGYADSIAGGGVNSFGTIAVSGQSNVVADAAPDTLTLVAGSNITLTTNASTDTVTIAASGGGGSGTVTTTGTPATGNLSKFSGATSITNGDLTGNVTTSGTLVTTIANSAVTYAKIQNVSANSKLLGSSATGSGAPPSEITLGTNLSMTGSTLNATGGGGGTIASTSDILKGDGAGNAVALGSATSGKVLKSNGTVFIASTETYAAPGTSGNVLTSDGTNWTSAVPVVTAGSTTTFTNKRINPRVDASTSASATTWAPNSDSSDIFELAGALTVAVTTISNPSGTPVDGQKLIIRVKSDGSAHALTWSGTQWRASSDLALPSTTTAAKTLYLGFIYNGTDTKWDLLAKLDNF
jgi:hypothetical protein